MNCLKTIIFWLAIFAAIVVFQHKKPVKQPPAPIVHVVPKPEPAPVPEVVAPVREQQPAATATKRERAPAREQIKAAKRKLVNVKPVNGGHAVGVPCAKLKAGLDKYGYYVVVAGAPAYGFSKQDVDNAKKACGL